ncbi:MAG: hypothetical protein COV07_01255 [Candidatus Vogelbacteria bacterium CG10_big_fil_rev_8_21_14_0_10_45_14]|uniref:Lactamase n=1 Tax=Candidatus Vogelbacteria bacterium CG10_big_fil_rev_8_21_14_0_10_45_14 TaxID=1975042 RepID=A0A2H0RKP1_9BACT|nr:MAG: hypothetical protein COV07_01255 [Candidatus Vogelbacteria bacterium CG10_big_fil_rev_8_21_14_0_10_45_14]
MVITYHGMGLIKVTHGDMVVAMNPIGADAGMKPVRFGADLALISRNAPEWNGATEVNFGSKTPFVINGAGEYEVTGLFIKGFYVEEEVEGDKYINTIYTLLQDGINLCHIGALRSKVLPEKVKEKLGTINILFVPVTSRRKDLLSPEDAYALSMELESNIVVPLYFDEEGEDTKALQGLAKAFGAEIKKEDKLTLKKKDLDGRGSELVVISKS